MNKDGVEQLCGSLAQAAADAREVFVTVRMDVSEILQRFWCLQDQLHRFLDRASECPCETLQIQEQTYPSLIRDAVEIIALAEKGHFTEIAAVKRSCGSINRVLLELKTLKAANPPYRTATA